MNKLFAFLFTFVFIVSSCDPYYNIKTQIENNSGRIVIISHNFFETDSTRQTDTVITGNRLPLYSQEGYGYQVSQVLSRTTEISLVELTILLSDSTPYNRDPLNIDVWDKRNPAFDSENGTIRLDLQPADFN